MTYEDRLFRQRVGFGCSYEAVAYVAAVVIAAYGTEESLRQQKYNQSAQEEMQENQVKSNNLIVHDQEAALRQQEAQAAEAAAREKEKARLENQKALSSAVTSAGEAGVSGASYDAMVQEFKSQLSQYKEATNRQLSLQQESISSHISALQMGGANTNLNLNAPVSGPNYGAAAMQFGSEALSAYRAYDPNAFKKPSRIQGQATSSGLPSGVGPGRV